MTVNNTPSMGQITSADVQRSIAAGNTGRIYHLHRATLAPAGCDNQGRYETRRWGASGYGSEDIAPAPHRTVIPLSLLGRLALAWRRFWLG